MTPSAAAQLSAAAVASFKHIDDRLVLSADGRWVALTIHQSLPRGRARPGIRGGYTSPEGSADCDLWIVNTATGETHNVTLGRGSSWGPSWSPDGTRLAFFSDADGALRVWVWERMSRRLRRVSAAIVQPGWSQENAPRWTPNGRGLLVAIAPGDAPDRKATADRVGDTLLHVYRSSPGAAEGSGDSSVSDVNGPYSPLSNLVVVDVNTGRQRRLVRRESIVGWWLAPSGRTVGFLVDRGTAPTKPGAPRLSTALVDVVTMDVTTGRRTIVASHLASLGRFGLRFSPDSRLIAYVTSALTTTSTYTTGFSTCFVAPVQGTARQISTAAQQLDWSQAPAWDIAGDSFYLLGHGTVWRIALGKDGRDDVAFALPLVPGRQVTSIATTGDGTQAWSPGRANALVVVVRDSVTQGDALVQVDVQTGRTAPLHSTMPPVDGAPAAIESIIGSNASRALVFTLERLNAPADLWTTQAVRTELRAPHRLTHLNPALEQQHLSDGRVISWRDTSGRQLRGLLMLPTNYDRSRRYPLIVYQYPGTAKSQEVNKFGGDADASLVNMHLFTTRGYAVLLPDVPAPGTDTMQLVLTWRAIRGGVDRAIAMGIADSNRLGIMGHSYGGYATLGTIIATSRFRAAVATSGGFYNAPAQYLQLQPDGQTIYIKAAAQVYGKSLWEAPTVFVANSPIFFLDRVHTPLLLVDGAQDDGATPAQSAQVYVGLQFLGREVEYALYPERGHSYTDWTWPDQVDVINRIVGWFDDHLTDITSRRQPTSRTPQ